VNLRLSRKTWLTRVLPVAAVAAVIGGGIIAIAPSASAAVSFEVQNLDGSGNNVNNPTWGKAGTPYARVGPAKYTDGISQPFGGPNARQISNRVINDTNVDVFDERRLSQFAWQWGQFLDHTFDLRDGGGSTATAFNINFQPGDPLESFTDTLGVIAVNRSAQAPGTGTSTSNPRQQTNTITSYISAQNVYSSSPTLSVKPSIASVRSGYSRRNSLMRATSRTPPGRSIALPLSKSTSFMVITRPRSDFVAASSRNSASSVALRASAARACCCALMASCCDACAWRWAACACCSAASAARRA